jgi:F-type H+-transporting ATPase subunit b
MDIILPKVPDVFYALLSFGVLFYVLSRFAFPPIVAMIDKREQAIRDSIEKAEETRIEAERLLQDYRQQLAEARTEATQIIDQARKLGEDARAKIEEDARQESTNILARAREEIDAEKKKALIELTARVADISIGAASKVVEKSLSKEDHLKLIDEYISQVGAVSEG